MHLRKSLQGVEGTGEGEIPQVEPAETGGRVMGEDSPVDMGQRLGCGKREKETRSSYMERK